MIRYKALEGVPLCQRHVDPVKVRYAIPRNSEGRVVDLSVANRVDVYALETPSWCLRGSTWPSPGQRLILPVSDQDWDQHGLVQYHGAFALMRDFATAEQIKAQVEGRMTRLVRGSWSVFHGAGGIRLNPL